MRIKIVGGRYLGQQIWSLRRSSTVVFYISKVSGSTFPFVARIIWNTVHAYRVAIKSFEHSEKSLLRATLHLCRVGYRVHLCMDLVAGES